MAVATQAPVMENPLVAGLERLPVHPTSLVIFGATGDLAKRKLLPAIYNLAHEGALPERFNLVGTARREMSDEQFREMAARAVRQFSRRAPDEEVLRRLLESASYVSGAVDQEALYGALQGVLAGFEEEAGRRLNRCFYLATAPRFFPVIVRQLGHYGLHKHEDAEVRIVIEKPFGTSLADAERLNHELLSVFDESQVYRIDHYLGKETVQNLLAFRFANGMFEPW
jgi:glucose-6-phosphate 1-dehydrogenase